MKEVMSPTRFGRGAISCPFDVPRRIHLLLVTLGLAACGDAAEEEATVFALMTPGPSFATVVTPTGEGRVEVDPVEVDRLAQPLRTAQIPLLPNFGGNLSDPLASVPGASEAGGARRSFRVAYGPHRFSGSLRNAEPLDGRFGGGRGLGPRSGGFSPTTTPTGSCNYGAICDWVASYCSSFGSSDACAASVEACRTSFRAITTPLPPETDLALCAIVDYLNCITDILGARLSDLESAGALAEILACASVYEQRLREIGLVPTAGAGGP